MLRTLARRGTGWMLATAARAVPPRRRWAVVVGVARLLAPRTARTALDGPLDVALFRAMSGLTRRGFAFAPRLRVQGAAHLEAAIAAGRGTLVASCHALPTYVLVRYLRDAAHDATMIADLPTVMVVGAPDCVRSLQPSPSLLLQARTRLRAGATLCAMLDRWSLPEAQRTEFATAHGRVRVSDALVRVAVRTGARVVFAIARTDPDGTIALTFAAPPAGATVEEIMAAYVAFVQERTA